METNPLTYEEYLGAVEDTPLIGDEVCLLKTDASYLALKRLLTPDYFASITKKYIEDAFNLDERGINIEENFSEIFEAKKTNEENIADIKVKRLELFKKYGINYQIN